jgi:hypothetical protein
MGDALAAAAAETRILIDLDGSTSTSALAGGWQEPIQRALDDRVITEVRVNFASGERYRYRRWHRWRFWRKSLAAPKA